MTFHWLFIGIYGRYMKLAKGALHFELIAIYKGKPAEDVRVHCVVNLNIFVSKQFLCFVCMQPFDVNPTQFNRL